MIFWCSLAQFTSPICWPAPSYNIPPWSCCWTTPFLLRCFCLAVFEAPPTNLSIYANLFYKLLAYPIYSTPTICSKQMLNAPTTTVSQSENSTMPKPKSAFLDEQLFKMQNICRHRRSKPLHKCQLSNYMPSYYLKSQKKSENNTSVESLSNVIYWHDDCPYSLRWLWV